MRRGIGRRAREVVAETARAPRALLGFVLEALRHLLQPVRVVVGICNQLRALGRGERPRVVETLLKFGLGVDVGVGEEQGDLVSEVAQRGHARARARPAARMEQHPHAR